MIKKMELEMEVTDFEAELFEKAYKYLSSQVSKERVWQIIRSALERDKGFV